jgi:ABC-type transport system involved in multi-copper enzyme maturation permease subunit
MKPSLVLQPLGAARSILAALALGLATLILIATLSYEAFGSAQFIAQLLERTPRGLRALTGGENLLTPAGYFGAIFFHPLALTFQGAAAIAVVTRLAQEVETHVVELLLCRPVTRHELALSRYLASLLGMAVVIGTGALAFLAGRALTPAVQELGVGQVLGAFAYDLLLWAAIGGVAFLATCRCSARGTAVSWSVGFAALSFLANFVGQLWKPLEPLRRASVFYYFRPAAALAGDAPRAGHLILLGSVAVASVVIGLLIFRRRDIAA